MEYLANLDNYRYGPVTISKIFEHENSLTLTVQGSSLRSHHAVYSDCVYGQIDTSTEGERLLLVEEKKLKDIISMRDNYCIKELAKITPNTEKLFERWHNEGRHFFVHYSDKANKEYLVVCGNLNYD